MIELSFLKKLAPRATFSLDFLSKKPKSIVGIDIGTFSTKVIQLRYEKERGILETYGELLSQGYFKGEGRPDTSFIHHSDSDIAALLKDIIHESNVTSKEAVFSIPASSSFITTISFPPVSEKELRDAIPYEARRYVPIPISEVVLDWDLLGTDDDRDKIEVLLIAVPKDIVEKFKRISELVGINLQALEVETFSIIRSLGGNDTTPTMFVNIGYQSTTLGISDRGKLRMSHSLSRGSSELTKTLERGLGVNQERAESIKREAGLSEKMEERETTIALTPSVETLLAEIERFLSIYNRRAPRTVQKINITGSGSNLKGLVEYTVSKFGLEVTRGNPFARVVVPAFMQPLLREIGPGFSVAVGLALHEITSR